MDAAITKTTYPMIGSTTVVSTITSAAMPSLLRTGTCGVVSVMREA